MKVYIDTGVFIDYISPQAIGGLTLRSTSRRGATVDLQLSNMELLIRGIRAADSLHIASAINFDAEVFISVDEDLLKLDGVITNISGNSIKFCDTDLALTIL